jgi:hypothetical protein
MASAEDAPARPMAPLPAVPPRRPGSVRRTSNVDMTRPHGPDGVLVLTGRARDMVTTTGGRARASPTPG